MSAAAAAALAAAVLLARGAALPAAAPGAADAEGPWASDRPAASAAADASAGGPAGGAAAVPMPLRPYDPVLARGFAAFTQASYCGADARLLRWACGPCEAAGMKVLPGSVKFLEHHELFQRNSTFMYLARLEPTANFRGGGCMIAVRGSETVTNWIRNLQVWARQLDFEWCEGCKIETGFLTIIRNAWPYLLGNLSSLGCVPAGRRRPLDGRSSDVYVTGHSLGAAIATLAMTFLDKAGFKVQLSYNFESPRVGNEAFSRVFSEVFSRRVPIYRITHWRDPVPHLPLENMVLWRYRHVNYEVYYDKDGSWRVCAEQEDPRCADRYNVLQTALHVDQHCHSPLAMAGSLCECAVDAPGWAPALVPPTGGAALQIVV